MRRLQVTVARGHGGRGATNEWRGARVCRPEQCASNTRQSNDRHHLKRLYVHGKKEEEEEEDVVEVVVVAREWVGEGKRQGGEGLGRRMIQGST